MLLFADVVDTARTIMENTGERFVDAAVTSGMMTRASVSRKCNYNSNRNRDWISYERAPADWTTTLTHFDLMSEDITNDNYKSTKTRHHRVTFAMVCTIPTMFEFSALIRSKPMNKHSINTTDVPRTI